MNEQSELIIDYLREALLGCWEPCGCGHGACKRCRRDEDAKAAIAIAEGDATPQLALLRKSLERCSKPTEAPTPELAEIFERTRLGAIRELTGDIENIHRLFKV